jgi:8-oxo-dGTP diphosphatase
MIKCQWEDGNSALLRHVTVNVLVIDGAKILLVKRAKGTHEGGKFCLPGGFMERNETLVGAAKREVLEETGYSIENLNLFYINDNPKRPHDLERQNIDFIYLAKLISKTGESDDEIESAVWFSIDSIPKRELFAFDHFENIIHYKKYLKNPFSLPLLD